MLDKCRILVISHNVFCDNSDMGRTLANYFKGTNNFSLAQLYFHSEVPGSNICENYYRVTDFDMLSAVFKGTKVGTIFTVSDIKKGIKTNRTDAGIQANIYQMGRKRKPFMYICRNLLWNTKKWKNERLEEWIDSFAPDIVFFASGDYSFSYNIAMYVAKSRKIPLVLSVCDDYIFNDRFSILPLYWLNRISYKRKFKETIRYAATTIYICDMLKNKYTDYYKCPGETIMTLSDVEEATKDSHNEIVIVSYLGNLGYDRWKSLVDIGRTLKKLGNEYVLDVYSQEPRKRILKHMSEDNGIRYKGAVSYEEVQRVMKNSDILVHVEDFSGKNIKKVRYSFSTKIADSLKCGTCLLAYGPKNVASIDYLKSNSAACVASTKQELYNALKNLIYDEELRSKYIKKALKLAAERHDVVKGSERFAKVICSVIEEKSK